ncbi:MAG: hypothetical protein AAFP90_14490, partial [Planctomycetota bacterium]
MIRRKKRLTLAPNLFPFLAVLVCTMGTLILLLALVAQNAKQASAAAPSSEGTAPSDLSEEDVLYEASVAEELREKNRVAKLHLEEVESRSERYLSARDQQTDLMDQKRDQLAYMDSAIGKLKERLKRLSNEIRSATDPDAAKESITEAKAQLAKAEEALRAERERIAKLEEQSPPNDQPRIVIVPHKGPNGTDRRPLYIECTAEGVIIRPEGTKIDADSLGFVTPKTNPLDAALRTARSYWQRHDPTAPSPYPLLVVRPGGIKTYSLARAAMRSWDDQYGYELVPDGTRLAYPASDPALASKMNRVVQQTMLAQSALASRLAYGA